MADKVLLEQCRETIGEAQYLTLADNNTALQINMEQCKLLARKLSHTQEALDKIQQILIDPETGGSSSTFPDWSPATKELHRVLKRAEALIKDCCCNDQWLKAAIRQGDLKESFSEVLYDLQWCTSVLCSILLSSTTRDSSVFEPALCDGQLGAFDYFALSIAAKQDQERLKNSLKSLKADHVCSGESCQQNKEQCLATKLLERVDAEALPINRRDLSKSSLLSTSPIFLWLDPRDLLSQGIKLGEGAFGTVHETDWRGDKYAIKTFERGSDYSFKDEIAALAGLNHPHIVRLVCCSESTYECSLVMELMHKDLYALLRERKMSANYIGDPPFSRIQAVDLMLQIAEGMKYIHSNKLAHRDLKSPNILMKSADPQLDASEGLYIAKVADFGLSKSKEVSTMYDHATLNIGTRRWMAPEVWKLQEGEERPERFHPMKTDVYSFGIVCFELLTGKNPFENLSRLHQRLISGERPKLPEDCPARLVVLIQRCWDGNPRLRPEFSDVCRELRYIKGLLLRADDMSMLEKEAVGVFRVDGAQVQGPWGGGGGRQFCDGVATSVKRILVKHSRDPKCIWHLEVEYDINGRRFKSYHGDPKFGSETEEIKFKNPGEFLTQIEGSFGITHALTVRSRPITSVTSLIFHTNLKTYGPYGSASDTPFRSGSGRVVGFFGRSDRAIDQLGVFTVMGEN